jgi:hypothetical protein
MLAPLGPVGAHAEERPARARKFFDGDPEPLEPDGCSLGQHEIRGERALLLRHIREKDSEAPREMVVARPRSAKTLHLVPAAETVRLRNVRERA